jgi:hypothetical protein
VPARHSLQHATSQCQRDNGVAQQLDLPARPLESHNNVLQTGSSENSLLYLHELPKANQA